MCILIKNFHHDFFFSRCVISFVLNVNFAGEIRWQDCCIDDEHVVVYRGGSPKEKGELSLQVFGDYVAQSIPLGALLSECLRTSFSIDRRWKGGLDLTAVAHFGQLRNPSFVHRRRFSSSTIAPG